MSVMRRSGAGSVREFEVRRIALGEPRMRSEWKGKTKFPACFGSELLLQGQSEGEENF
jgi:hypothetical protein